MQLRHAVPGPNFFLAHQEVLKEFASTMLTQKNLACLALLALAPLLRAQTPPTSYTIIEGVNGEANGATTTIYRSGDKVLQEFNQPAQAGNPASRTLTLIDLTAHANWSWNPAASPISCSAGTFTGDWGDPFQMTAELNGDIAKGDLKPGGAETLAGVATTLYTGNSGGTAIKAWLDQKDGLVVKVVATDGGQSMTLADVRRVMIGAPPATHFVLPPACAGSKPPPTPAELIAAETGDNPDNWVHAYGSSSKNSCSIAVRVVVAGTMAPVNKKYQAAIDTTYNVDNPPPYTFGVGEDGTATFSGGGLHEITSQVRNGMLRIDNPPAYFALSINVPTPHYGASDTLIYRQCFAPVTLLYDIVKDPNDPGKGSEWLYAKSGKYATLPTH